MKNIESVLRKAFLMLDREDIAGRFRVYQAARSSINKMPPDSKERALEAFKDAVIRIEAEYSGAEAAENANNGAATEELPVQSPSPAGVQPASNQATFKPDQPQGDEQELQTGPSVDEPAFTVKLPTAQDTPHSSEEIVSRIDSGGGFAGFAKRDPWLVPALCGVAGLGVIATVLYLVSPLWATPPTEGSTEASRQQALESSASTNEQNTAVTLFSAELPQDIESLSINVTGTKSGVAHLANRVQDDRFVLDESVILFSKDLIAVDPQKTYTMQIVFNENSGSDTWPRLNAGVATFDSEKNLERDPPGAHRYFVNLGRVDGRSVSATGEEVSLLNLITGTGNESHNTFRPKTRFVRPVVMFNIKEGEKVLDLKRIEFVELK